MPNPFTNLPLGVILLVYDKKGKLIMTNDNTVPADGYYREEASSEEFDLSFLDDDEPTKQN